MVGLAGVLRDIDWRVLVDVHDKGDCLIHFYLRILHLLFGKVLNLLESFDRFYDEN